MSSTLVSAAPLVTATLTAAEALTASTLTVTVTLITATPRAQKGAPPALVFPRKRDIQVGVNDGGRARGGHGPLTPPLVSLTRCLCLSLSPFPRLPVSVSLYPSPCHCPCICVSLCICLRVFVSCICLAISVSHLLGAKSHGSYGPHDEEGQSLELAAAAADGRFVCLQGHLLDGRSLQRGIQEPHHF